MASLALHLFQRQAEIECTEVGPLCPVEDTIYGYRPSLAWNALFLAIFAASTIAHIGQGIFYRTWSFLAAMSIGGLCLVVGKGGRLMMNDNPYSEIGFNLQIVLLTFAPAFLAAGIYLQLKHLIITFGSSWSFVRPAWYTYIFITCDFISIALQGAGGGLAATSEAWESSFGVGNDLTIAGLVFQVVTLAVFGALSTEYLLRTVLRHKHELNPATESLRRSIMFKGFLAAIALAYVTILIRCCYRVAELVGGWSEDNHLLREEPLYLGLDSL
jgi:hypothetical protein